VCFENKMFYFTLKKRASYYNAGGEVANSEVVGLAPGMILRS
jgi:hypothetical protein